MSDVVDEDTFANGSSAYPPSIQAGIPKLGDTPRGWTRLPLRKLLVKVERPAKLVDGECYQLVTAKRNRGGIVAREDLRGDQIKTKTQFYVEAGDFLISNRQISHGACGLVPESLHGAVVSNEYTAFHTSKLIEPDFLNALSHSIYFQETCFHSSVGVHVEKLVFRLEDWMRWEFDVPPLPEQRRIVTVLGTWDRAIEQTERLIAFERMRFEGVLARTIGFGRSRQDLAQSWSRKELGELVTFKSGGTPDRANAAFWGGDIPWVSAKDLKTFVVETSLDRLTADGLAKVNDAPAGSILILVRGMGLFKDIPIGVANKTVSFNQDIKALVPKPDIVPRFLGYALRAKRRSIMDRVESAGHGTGRLSSSFLESLPVSFPDTRSQKKIVDLLDLAERELNLKVDYLLQLRTQKRGLMQKLLSGEWRLDERFDAEALSPLASNVGGHS